MLLLLNILLMMHGKHGEEYFIRSDFLIILKSITLLLNWSKKNFFKYALDFKVYCVVKARSGSPSHPDFKIGQQEVTEVIETSN